MKCLIIDDDKFERDGLIGLISRMDRSLEFRDVKNGKLGLDILTKEDIDIVITDIKMPVMDGMTFLERAKAIKPDVIYIIYSGYNDFIYAKQALSLKVMDFLLKPIDEEELKKVMKKAFSLIKNVYKEDTKLKLSTLISDEPIPTTDITENPGHLIILKTENSLTDLELKGIEKIIAEFNNNSIFFKISKKTYIIWCENISRLFVINLINSILSFYKNKINVIISEKLTTNIEIKKVFELLMFILNNSIFVNNKNILFPEAYLRKPFTGEIDNIEEFIDNQLKTTGYILPDVKKTILENINKKCVIKEAEDNKIKTLSDLRNYIATFSESKDDYIVTKVKSFISENYQNDITIEDIAEVVHLNSTYLCSIFKKKTNITLIKYLTFYRIEIAKKLLEKSESKSSDVAQAVGYKNNSYFNSVFKMSTGMTPGEYKRSKL